MKPQDNISPCLNQNTNSPGYEIGMLHSFQYREPGLFSDSHGYSKPYLNPLLLCLHYEPDKLKKILAFAEPKATDVIHAEGEPPLEPEHLSFTPYIFMNNKHPVLLTVID